MLYLVTVRYILPNGKMIFYNNNLYYDVAHSVGKTTINSYKVSLTNITLEGISSGNEPTILPIQNISTRFIEYWTITNDSAPRNYPQTCSVYCHVEPYNNHVYGSISPIYTNHPARLYILMHDGYTYNDTDTYSLDTIGMFCSGTKTVSGFNITYECYYIA